MLDTETRPVPVQQKRSELDQSHGIIVQHDPEEAAYDRAIKLWMKDEVTYDYVREHIPRHKLTMIERLTRALHRFVTRMVRGKLSTPSDTEPSIHGR